MSIFDRLKFCVGVRFDFDFSNGVVDWLFNPGWIFTYPGKILINPRLETTGSLSDFHESPNQDWVSDILLISGCLRIIGFDFGLDFYYRVEK